MYCAYSWSKLALRASLPKRIWRALVSVRDSHVDSTVVAVRAVVASKIGVPLDGKYMWVFDKVCLTLFAAPQKNRRPRKRFVLKSKPATLEATIRAVSACCSSEGCSTA